MEAVPSDAELRSGLVEVFYDDAVLDNLIEQAMAANPDLQAAAERFLQARDVMQVRSRRIPQIGLGGKVGDSPTTSIRSESREIFQSPDRLHPVPDLPRGNRTLVGDM